MANAAREQGARSWQFKLAFVWGDELISTLTSSILQMGFIWHITLSTNSANMLSLASLAGFLPLALFGMFAGAIVDRLPLKRVLIGSDLFIAAVSAFVACVSLAGGGVARVGGDCGVVPARHWHLVLHARVPSAHAACGSV